MGMREEGEEKVERVEESEASGLDEAHEDLMVLNSIFGTIAEGYFSQDDIVAQEAFGIIIVGADLFEFEAGDEFMKLTQEFVSKLFSLGMESRGLERAAQRGDEIGNGIDPFGGEVGMGEEDSIHRDDLFGYFFKL